MVKDHRIALCCLALFAICGCQSGIVDPGRSRGAAPPPSVVTPPPSIQQPAIPSSPVSQGSTTKDWSHVTRQPAASVVQMPADQEAQTKYHTVLSGESWSSLARQHGLTVKQLADANGMDQSATLQTGQIVYIPGK